MATIFEKIVKGEIPAYKIAENENFLAFLDVFPIVKGHVLVIPKVATDYIFTESDNTIAELMVFAKKVANAMDKSFDAKRIGVSVIGLEVPHTHVHLIPINNVADMDFGRPKLQLDKAEMLDIAERIKINL